MGGATSKNIAKALNEVAINSVMQVIQDNSVTIGGENIASFGPGCSDSTFTDIKQSIFISVNVKAAQAAINSPDFTTSMTNSVNQLAKAVNGALNPGKAKTSNVANVINKYTANILAQFQQNCSFASYLKNIVTCDATGITVKGLTQTAMLNMVSSCAQKATNDPKLQVELDNALKQTGSATNEGLLGPLMMIIAIIAAAIVAFFAFGGKSVGQVFSTPWPWLTGVGLGGAYVGVRWYTKTGLFAYKPKVDPYPTCGLAGTPDPSDGSCQGPKGTCQINPPSGAYQPCECPSGATSVEVTCSIDPNTGVPKTATIPCGSDGYTQADITKACGGTPSVSSTRVKNVDHLHY